MNESIGETGPAAVVFDCDGLLVDTETLWTRAERELFRRHGRSFTLDDKKALLGTGWLAGGRVLERLLDRPGDAEELSQTLLTLVTEEVGHGVDALPGALELVEELHGRVPIAVASNSPRGFVEEVDLVARDREGELVARRDVVLDRQLREDRDVPHAQVDELLVAEVLTHLDPTGEPNGVARQRAELHVLGPEAGGPTGSAAGSVERLGRDEVHRRRADEARHEEVARARVQLLRRSRLLEHSLVHHDDAVAHRHRLDLVVGDVDRRRAEPLLELEDLRARRHAQLGVEVRERLVHQERLGLAHDRAAERHALALPARELLRLTLQELVEVEDLRRFAHPPVDLLPRHVLVAKPEREVVVDRHVRVERVRLEDHRDVASARCDVVHDPVADQDPPVRDLLEPGEHPERGALPAPRGPDEDEELSILDLDGEVLDGLRAVEALGHVVVEHARHQSTASWVGVGGSAKRANARNEYATVRVRKGTSAAARPIRFTTASAAASTSAWTGRERIVRAASPATSRAGRPAAKI